MDTSQYQVATFDFRGRPYLVACQNLGSMPQDASWFTYEDEAVVRDRDWTIAEGDVVLDVGAAYGSYVMTALVSGAAAVHSWNPNSNENNFMRATLELNGWSDKCIIHEDGLWSKTGFLRDTDLEFSETEPVEGGFKVRTLDSYDLGLSRVDWLKLDVEGAEVEVLHGAEQLIRKYMPKVVVENHQFKDPTIQQRVKDFLGSIGYDEIRVVQYHGVSHGLHVPRAK